MKLKREVDRAKTLYAQGKAEMALSVCDAILSIIPNDFDTLLLSGTIDCRARPQRAVKKLTQALSLKPDSIECLNSLSSALIEMEQFDVAQSCARHALAIKSDYWPAVANVAVTLAANNDHLGACKWYDQAIALAPRIAMIYSNRANSLTKLQLFESALTDYKTALKIDEDSATIHLNYGHLLEEMQQFSHALVEYTRAIEIDPHNAEVRYNRALLNLYLGNLKDGWAEHVWRWKRKKLDSIPIKTNRPTWTRDMPKGRVLVWAEQGVGDHIFFSSFLRELSADSTEVIVSLDSRLLPLFRRSFPQLNFLSDRGSIAQEQYDYQIAMADLAAQYRPSLESLNHPSEPYLCADQLRVEKIRAELRNVHFSCSDCLVVGISWSSRNGHSGSKRSLKLSDLAQSLNKKNVVLVNLQYGDVDSQLKELKNDFGIEVYTHRSVDNTNDLDGLAALIQACDLIVSADNSTVHLSGALGKPTWICLPAVPNWRWFAKGTESPWFRDVKLYRQRNLGEWDYVLQLLSNDLASLLRLN
jgi:tetratricopeptide (TPR) repeat protein